MKDKVLIGQITGTFGIKGELKVYSESDFVEYRFRKNAKIYLSDNVEYTVSSSRTHKGNVLITINDINDINLVLDKVGMKIYAPSDDEPPLNDEEYYVDDLVGLKVINQHDENIGTVKDVIEIPSGYLLEIIDDKDNRFLLPFVDEYITEITDDSIIITDSSFHY